MNIADATIQVRARIGPPGIMPMIRAAAKLSPLIGERPAKWLIGRAWMQARIGSSKDWGQRIPIAGFSFTETTQPVVPARGTPRNFTHRG